MTTITGPIAGMWNVTHIPTDALTGTSAWYDTEAEAREAYARLSGEPCPGCNAEAGEECRWGCLSREH